MDASRQSSGKVFCAFFIFLLQFPLLCHAAIPQLPESETLPALVLYADRELSLPLSKLASLYSQTHHASIATVFVSPEAAQDALTNGETVDVYLSAYPGVGQNLAAQGMIDVDATQDLGTPRLVLAASKGWWKEARPARWTEEIKRNSWLPTLIRSLPDTRLLIGEPTRVASGRYASDLMQRQGWQVPLAPRIAYTPATSITLSRLNQPGMVGIVDEADLAQSPELEIIARFAPEFQPKGKLQGFIIATDRMNEAKKLLSFLSDQLNPKPKILPQAKPAAMRPLR